LLGCLAAAARAAEAAPLLPLREKVVGGAGRMRGACAKPVT